MNLARLEMVLAEGWNGQLHTMIIDPDTLKAVRTCEANYASVKDSAALGDLPFSAKPEFVAVVEEYQPVIVAVTDAAGKTIKTLQAELRYDAKHGVARLYTRQVDVINMQSDLFESELQSHGTSD